MAAAEATNAAASSAAAPAVAATTPAAKVLTPPPAHEVREKFQAMGVKVQKLAMAGSPIVTESYWRH